MIFRRFLAILLGFVFIVSAQAVFLLFAFTNRLFAPGFYKSQSLQQPLYDIATRMTAQNLYDKEPLLQKYFTQADLQREIQNVFTFSLFSENLNDFTKDLVAVKANKKTEVIFSFHVLRQSLLTVSRTLSFQIYEKIPRCIADQVPSVSSQGIPSCVPMLAEYNLLSAPTTRVLEQAVYSAVPEQVQYDFALTDHKGDSLLFLLFQQSEKVLLFFYALLLCLLALMALLVYWPFQHILRYLGVTFLLSGIVGYFMSFNIPLWPTYIFNFMKVSGAQNGDISGFFYKDFQSIGSLMFAFLAQETQKLALGFLGLGLSVILVGLFLKRGD